MSPSIIFSLPDAAAVFRFSCFPFRKLSKTVTLQPASTRWSTKWEPMNPAPPVTRTLEPGNAIFIADSI